MIDPSKKKALIAHIKACQWPKHREILLSPEMYFDGYDDDECIICTNARTISCSNFSHRLQSLALLPEVAAIYIRFCDYDDALEDEDCWIGSDSVYLVTSSSLGIVSEWFADLFPTEVREEPDLADFPQIAQLPQGHRLVAVWWN